MHVVLFVHGLNTYGDDLLHVGPFTRGLMHERIERAFAARDVPFVPLLGLGAGSPEGQAVRALSFIKAEGLDNGRTSLHLLGHSTGGLVARVLATSAELKANVKTVMTIGTPHLGTEAARFGMEFDRRHPLFRRLFASFGYDTLKKNEIFRHFTPESMAEFNRRFPSSNEVKEFSLVCESPANELAWPLKFLHRRLLTSPNGSIEPSDGFIATASQKRGQVIGPFRLDHFGELGYFFQTRPSSRARSEVEFQRLVDAVASYVAMHRN